MPSSGKSYFLFTFLLYRETQLVKAHCAKSWLDLFGFFVFLSRSYPRMS